MIIKIDRLLLTNHSQLYNCAMFFFTIYRSSFKRCIIQNSGCFFFKATPFLPVFFSAEKHLALFFSGANAETTITRPCGDACRRGGEGVEGSGEIGWMNGE